MGALYMSAREAMGGFTYRVQLTFSIIFNFGINFLIEWWALSKGFKFNKNNLEPLWMWRMNPDVNSCIGMDMYLTAFLLSFFTVVFASNGVVKDIEDGKCKPVDTSVTQRGWWQYTPVRVHGLCLRGLLTALQMSAVAGTLGMLLFWAGIGSEEMPGLEYICLKSTFAAIAIIPVYSLVFFSAADSRNFEGVAFQALLAGSNGEGVQREVSMNQALADDQSTGGKAPPLVGSVSRV